MGALARRLRADGVEPVVAGELAVPAGGSPRAVREAVTGAHVVLCCLSRRSWGGVGLVQPLAGVLELLPLLPDPSRALIALRLSTAELPPALQGSPTIDLFNAQGYQRLLAALRAHQAVVAPPPAPEPEPLPPPPAAPALTLSGGFGLPALDRQGLVRRLGRGVARGLFLIDNDHALVVSGGGPALIPLDGGAPRWAIDCPTRCAALSPSGRLLGLAAGNQIVLWSLVDGSLLGVCAGHTATVSSLAFAPDERTLASAGHDRSVRLWRIGEQTPTLLATLLEHTDQATSVAISPDGALIASGSADRTVRIWRSLDRARVQTLSGLGGAVEALAFSPDGRTLAAGSRGRIVRLWETAGWRPLRALEGHTGAVEALAFSPDGATLATGASDGKGHLWPLQEGRSATSLNGHSGAIASLAFSPDGARLATVGADARLLVWDVTDGAPRETLRPLSGRISAMVVSPDGALLAVGAGDGSLAIYGLDSDAALRRRFRDHQGAIGSVAFAAGGQVVTTGADRVVRVSRLDNGVSTLLLQTQGAVHGAALAPNGTILASFDAEGTVQLWRISGGAAPSAQFWRVLRGLRGRPRRVGFAPRAGAMAVATDDGGVSLWQLAQLEANGDGQAQLLTLPSGPARSLAFSADGTLFAAGSDDGRLQLWQIRSGATAASLQGQRALTSLAFSADGRSLAAGDADGTILVWRLALEGGKRRQPAPTLIGGHAGAIEQLAFAPAGGPLVSGSADGTVRIWRVS